MNLVRESMFAQKWPKVPLEEIVDFLDSKRKPIKQSERLPGPYPYYGANGQQDSVADYIFDEPLILLAEDGGHFGDPTKTIAYQVEGKCWVNNHAHVLRPKTNIDIRFLCRQLEHYDVLPFITGTTRAKLTKTSASRIPILLPPLSEQRRIAAILDKADEVRRKRQEAIRLTEELLRSAFLDMFGDPVTNPKGWPTKSLRKLTHKIGSGATPKGGKASYQDEGVSLIRSMNVYDDRFSYNNLAHINNQQAHDLRNVIVESSDILMNITGASVCRCAMVPDDVLPARVNQHVAIIRANKNELSPEFLLFLLISPNYKRFLLKLATNGGATREALTKEQIEGLTIITPSIELQSKFSDIVKKQRAMVSKSLVTFEGSDNLFNSLVQCAFRGEL